EHLMAVGTQTSIIGAKEHLKCKLLSGTFKDAALRWYMTLPRNSITGYADFHKKIIHQFAGSKHVQVTATTLFVIRQGHNENLQEYLARFSEATIKVSNPNQEMFVAAFHNGLTAGQFNESLVQKPATTMQEIMKWAKCYIKGEESNAEKRSRDSKTEEEYSRLNDTKVHVLDEILNAGLARLPPAPDRHVRLKDLIEKLISSGHLRKILEKAAQGSLNRRTPPNSPRKSSKGDEEEKEQKRITVNTITRGFAGGDESRVARKRYLRRIIQETNLVGHVSFPPTPEISFSANDGNEIFPHDDDPLVIQVQILNCDVKRVLIDSGSSADIMYWEAFKAMQLAGEQLKPYNGTLVGFAG
ncbi:gag-pol polyprotein, partial [Trifolium medium]|nr:gag-pol polyprotein [Trifolium medium]